MKTIFEGLDLSGNKIANLAAGTETRDAVNKSQLDSAGKLGACFSLCEGFTPAGTGADIAEFPIPYDPADGTTSITWTIRRITLRVNVAGGAPAATVEKSTVAGAFSASTIGTVTMSSGDYEASITSFTSSTVASGNKIRFNVGTLGTATGWTITVEMEES